jgi:hypothetical protein
MFINPDNQYHRGNVRSSDGKLFWAYQRKNWPDGRKTVYEYWVTPERFKSLDKNQESHRIKPESRARQNKYCSEWAKKHKERIAKVKAEYRQRPEIKERSRKYHAEYRKNPSNKEKFAYWRSRHKRDPEAAAKKKAYLAQYYANPEVKKRIAERRRRNENLKRLNDPAFLLKKRTRCRIYKALHRKNISKSTRTVDLVGCSYAFLKEHIEKQFRDGMAWDRLGSFHIDHIRPLASFDLTNPEQLKAAFHWKNLQPLTPEENIKKRDRLDWCHSENITFDSAGSGC